MSAPLPAPPAAYHIDWVDRDSVLPVFTYSRTTGQFTATVHASGRAGLSQQGDYLVFSVAGTDVMSIDIYGVVRAKSLAMRRRSSSRRLEFIRVASSVKEVLGCVTEQGMLSAFQFIDGTPPVTTDQMTFQDGVAIGKKGLVAQEFIQTDTLV